MATLWFKQCYVEPILREKKTDTIRTSRCRLQVGDVVAFSVGPRPAFAKAVITSRRKTSLKSVDPERQRALTRFYPRNSDLVKIGFRLI